MDLFTSLIEGNKKSFPWKGDSDNRVRGCIVKLMVRSIREGGGIAEHWVLFFDWTDRAATYEANDDDGFLIPSWNRGYPAVCYEWKMAQRFSAECSPRQVNSNARELPMNGKPYLLTDRNCHHWAIALASSIGVDIDCAVESYLPSDVRDVINFGYALNNITKFSSLLDGSRRASDSGHSRTAISAGSRIASSASTASTASKIYQDHRSSNGGHFMAASAAASHVGQAKALGSASRLATNDNSSENSTEQTIMAVGGAALFAAYAFGTLLKNITGDDEETSERRNKAYNS